MKTIKEIAAEIFDSMPISTRFSNTDMQIIKKHKEVLLELEDAFVRSFYDTLYSHPQTYAILKNDIRSNRENILRNWWQQTINGRFDDEYWEWQVFVGLIHIKKKVTNPMMIAMWGWMITNLRCILADKLNQDELNELMAAFERLAATIQSLTAESFLANYIEAIESATGFNNNLINRMVDIQIKGMIEKKRC